MSHGLPLRSSLLVTSFSNSNSTSVVTSETSYEPSLHRPTFHITTFELEVSKWPQIILIERFPRTVGSGSSPRAQSFLSTRLELHPYDKQDELSTPVQSFLLHGLSLYPTPRVVRLLSCLLSVPRTLSRRGISFSVVVRHTDVTPESRTTGVLGSILQLNEDIYLATMDSWRESRRTLEKTTPQDGPQWHVGFGKPPLVREVTDESGNWRRF